MLNSVLIGILALISGSIGYYIRFRIDKTKEINSKVTEKRREHYQEFVNIVVDILGANSQDKKTDNAKVMIDFHNFYKIYLVYASPAVINAFGDYFQYLYHDNQDESIDIHTRTRKHFLLLSQIIIKMRKDLGLSNRKLGEYGERVFRAKIQDIDDFFPKV